MNSDVKKLRTKIVDAQKTYNDLQESGTRAQLEEASAALKQARKELATYLTQGAEPCKVCDALPHGLVQPLGKGLHCVEVGCLACPHRRVRGHTPELAVQAWNEGDWIDPDKVVEPEVEETT